MKKEGCSYKDAKELYIVEQEKQKSAEINAQNEKRLNQEKLAKIKKETYSRPVYETKVYPAPFGVPKEVE